MNHIYRSIWSDASRTFVAVSEATSSRGKAASGVSDGTGGRAAHAVGGFALKALTGAVFLLFGGNALTAPVGGAVTAGQASIATTGAAGASTTTITQTSQSAALNWNSFNTRAGEAVVFAQPNSSAVALNRVLGTDPTSFMGRLSANGKVFLINPNGVLFGKSASVNVAGLVASTLDISNSDFMAGHYKFAGNSRASVVNQGSITAADGGYVALLGANVSNEGVIAARLGSIALAGGKAVTLDVAGDGLLSVSIDQGAVDALVNNGGLIQADGGQVLLSAQAAGQLLKTVVNNTGVIQAQTLQNKGGVIKLLGDMQSGTVNVGGTLDASAHNGGHGGFIETSAEHVKVANDARVTTLGGNGLSGSWLIDPVDYIIAATGGDITGAALAAQLATNGDITIQSSSGATAGAGDINVNDTVSWSANKLTLSAYNNININKTMDGGAAGKLSLLYGQGSDNGTINGTAATYNVNAPVNLATGQNFSTQLGKLGKLINYTVITALGTAADANGTDSDTLQGIAASYNLYGNYVLGANIDASPTSTFNPSTVTNNGVTSTVYAGFTPIGNNYGYGGSISFSGSFDGLGHTISKLTITQPSNDQVGLFASTTKTSVIKNVGLVDVNVAGSSYTGGLVGDSSGFISNSYSTGSVKGSDYTGGLVGRSYASIKNSFATGTVIGDTRTGGLVGQSYNSIGNSYATGTVTGGYKSGGLVGQSNNSIDNSYAMVDITSSDDRLGGLVGYSNFGNISNSYASGNVTSTGSRIGGLVGYISQGTISNSYAKDNVNGSDRVGGLVGYSSNAKINNSYATGIVRGDSDRIGGLVGYLNKGTINNSYATGKVTGVAGSTGGLVGYNFRGSISNSYATGSVSGSTNYFGGLVGEQEGGKIIDSYATGDVNIMGSGSKQIGGLVGYLSYGGSIGNSYATGQVTSAGNVSTVGGLVGQVDDTYGSPTAISNSYWNSSANPSLKGIGDAIPPFDSQNNNIVATALTATQLQTQASFTGFDFSKTWFIYEGYTAPLLRSFLTPLTITATDTVKTYDGLASTPSLTYSTTPNAKNVLGDPHFTGVTDVGTYTFRPTGLYSNQQGYLITTAPGTLKINPAPLIITAADFIKFFGQTADLNAYILAGLVNGETIGSISLNSDGSAATAGLGNYAIIASGAKGGTFKASNYNISYVNGVLKVKPAINSLYEGRDGEIEGTDKVMKSLKTGKAGTGEGEDKSPPNTWPTSDYLLTVDPELIARQ